MITLVRVLLNWPLDNSLFVTLSTELLKVIRETENDDLTGVMQKLISTYGDQHQVASIAVDIARDLVCIHCTMYHIDCYSCPAFFLTVKLNNIVSHACFPQRNTGLINHFDVKWGVLNLRKNAWVSSFVLLHFANVLLGCFSLNIRSTFQICIFVAVITNILLGFEFKKNNLFSFPKLY